MSQKKYSDYVNMMQKEFPDIEKESLEGVIEHGLRKIYLYASHCQDIFLKMDKSSNPFFLYIGYIDSPNKAKQIRRSKKEEHCKLRRLFRENNSLDGFSYFGLTDEEFEDFNKNRSLPRIAMYKIIEETYIRKGVNHIFKTKLDPEDYTYWIKIKFDYEIDKSEYIFKREDNIFKKVNGYEKN